MHDEARGNRVPFPLVLHTSLMQFKQSHYKTIQITLLHTGTLSDWNRCTAPNLCSVWMVLNTSTLFKSGSSLKWCTCPIVLKGNTSTTSWKNKLGKTVKNGKQIRHLQVKATWCSHLHLPYTSFVVHMGQSTSCNKPISYGTWLPEYGGSIAEWLGSQTSRVVRESQVHVMSRSDYQPDLFQVVPGSTPPLHLY